MLKYAEIVRQKSCLKCLLYGKLNVMTSITLATHGQKYNHNVGVPNILQWRRIEVHGGSRSFPKCGAKPCGVWDFRLAEDEAECRIGVHF